MEEVETKRLISRIKSLYFDEKFDEVLAELQKESNAQFVNFGGLDIVAEIGNLTREGEDASTALAFCRSAFEILASRGNAKELLMGFLEQFEILKTHEKFYLLLRPIQIILLRMPAKRGQSLLYVLDILHDNVQQLNVPKSYDFERKERLLLDLDPDIVKLTNSLEQVISFYAPFIKEVSRFAPPKKRFVNRVAYQRQILSIFILKLFDKPFAFVDLSKQEESSVSCVLTIVEKLVSNLNELESNFYTFFRFLTNSYYKTDELSSSNVDCSISQIALATFSYVLHVVGIFSSHLPCVYSNEYVFDLNLQLISVLLRQPEDCAVHKGLLLFDYLLKLIPNQHFCDEMLELDNYIMLAQDVINVMLTCKVSEFRKIAVANFKTYVDKFVPLGRYKLLLQLFHSNKQNPRIRGLIIHCYKENVIESLQRTPPTSWFVGRNLQRFLNDALRLQEGAKTDLLEEFDHVLTALNFLRYLLLRDDPLANVTGVWKALKEIESLFLDPLQTAIDLSKAHFQLELKSCKERQEKKMEYNVGYYQQLSVLESGITGFDLIQSVLSIVRDIITSKREVLSVP